MNAFTPPPRGWIADRLARLDDVLSKRTERSALALRDLTGSVTLTPETPEVGKPYFRASCSFNSLDLLRVAETAEEGSTLLLPLLEMRWTRLQPIRTVAEIEVGFVVFTHEPFRFQEIVGEVGRMRRLGMSLRSIGRAVGVDEKTVRKALGSEAAEHLPGSQKKL